MIWSKTNREAKEDNKYIFQCSVLAILQSLNRHHVRLHHCRRKDRSIQDFVVILIYTVLQIRIR